MVVGLVTRSATKKRAGIDVISSSDPCRARMIITLFKDNWVAQAGVGNVCVCIQRHWEAMDW